MTLRVVVADDQTLVRTGFRMIIDARDDLEVVGEASDGREAVRLTRQLAPDVVLMDVRMPGTDGIEATRELVRDQVCEVLVLTTFDIDEYVYGALRAGAAGFLLKSVEAPKLIESVKQVAAGEGVLEPAITRRLLTAFADTGPTPRHQRPAG